MSQRRPILVLAFCALAVAGLGLRDWPLKDGRAVALANGTLAPYGLSLAAEGPATLRVLPLPKLTLERVRVAAPDGAVLAEGERMAAEFDPVGWIAGRGMVGEIRLDRARLSPDLAAWSGPLTHLRRSFGAGAVPPRLVLAGSRIGDGDEARAIDLDVAWPLWSGALTARATLDWRGVPARLSLTRLRGGDLLEGRRSPFAAELAWEDGGLALDGTAALDADGEAPVTLAGRARFETQSLSRTLAWIGQDAPLAALAGPFSVQGSFETHGRAVSWPVVRVGTGNATLEGAGAFSLGTGKVPRLSVQATLAADRLDVGPLTGALLTLLGDGAAPVALEPLTRGDLDLRMSATEARVGPLTMDDLAASVLVRDAALEIALNRARLKGGVMKARLTLTKGADPAETDLRVQGGVDQIDLGGLMADLGASRWVSGPLQGTFVLDSHARDVAGLIGRVGGRVNVAIEDGALSGLDLADIIHRNGHLAPGALARRNGRTGFEKAAMVLRFSDGIGEIAEADLRGAGVAATLSGQVSLPEQRLDLVALLSLRQSAEARRGIRIAISGPWDDLTAQGRRSDADEPAIRVPTEARMPGGFHVPAVLDLPAPARAYAP